MNAAYSSSDRSGTSPESTRAYTALQDASRRGLGSDHRTRRPPARRGRPGSIDRPADLDRFRKLAAPAAVAAAIRLTPARAKARVKFERGERMWVEPKGVEQATSEPVARHKAARFTCPLVVDLCAGIGGDALALAARSDVLAVDLDPGMCRRLQYNAAVYDVAERVLPDPARAEAFAIPAGAWLHLDPDRRSHRKARSIAR